MAWQSSSDSLPRLLPVQHRVQRRGKDLERFVNLWRLGFVALLTLTLLVAQLVRGSTSAEDDTFLLVLGAVLLTALAFQLYLAWFQWDDRFGVWVVGADLTGVTLLLLVFVAMGRSIAATNSQTTFLGYFVVIALAGLRSDARVARGLSIAVPLSYALVVFLAVAWRQVNLNPPDPIYGVFRWEVQVMRLVFLTIVTWVTQFDAALGATDRAEALRDPLIGVYNRRFLEEFFLRELPRARRRQQPLSVLLVDLDGFKQFNDTYGHLAGDKILVAVASSLAAAVRAGDIVARYGGDEFVVVLPNTPGEAARRVARELVRVVPPQVSLSAGVGCLGADVEGAEDLLAAADAALFRAKQTGGGVVVA
jgi:diguanylate cyclase (GGDEF)-like protein